MYKIPEHIKTAIRIHAQALPEQEICGLVCQEEDFNIVYIPCTNIASNTGEHFAIDPLEYVAAEDRYFRIMAVVHSHPVDLPRFSAADKEQCNSGYLSWVLYYPDNFILMQSDNLKSLLGKDFVAVEQDCYRTMSDYLYKFQGLDVSQEDLPSGVDVSREDTHWWYTDDLIEGNHECLGFHEVVEGFADIRRGDVLLMTQENETTVSHMAVYIGNSRILHHSPGRLSETFILNGLFQNKTKMLVRHNANNY